MSGDSTRELRLGVLISGGGSTLANLVERITDGRLRGVRITLVISSRQAVAGLRVARENKLPLEVIRKKDFANPAEFSTRITAALDDAGVDLVALAGFLCHWRLPQKYMSRTLNIHPALLPAFGGAGMYGERVHSAVLRSGAHESGCTVHLVDEQYDHGAIVAQARVPLQLADTPESLAERVQRAERELYPQVIQTVAERGIEWLAQFSG